MKIAYTMTAALVALASQSVLADESGTDWMHGWTVGIGVAQIKKNVTMQDLQGPFTPPGLQLDIDKSTTAFFSLSHRINDGLEFQFAGGFPPTEHIRGKGPATVGSVPFNGEVLTQVKQLAPTVLINFVPHTDGPLQPYLGVGINYTHFYDIKSTAAGDAVSGGPTVTKLSDSWGAAGQIGLRYRIQDRWKLDFAVLKADVATKIVATTSGVTRRAAIDFDPTVAVMALDYAF